MRSVFLLPLKKPQLSKNSPRRKRRATTRYAEALSECRPRGPELRPEQISRVEEVHTPSPQLQPERPVSISDLEKDLERLTQLNDQLKDMIGQLPRL